MFAKARWVVELQLLLFYAIFILAAPRPAQCQDTTAQAKRAISVADMIEMARLTVPDPRSSHPLANGPAYFSPNGKEFVVVLEKPDLETNTNRFSLLLFHTRDVFSNPRPDTLLTMSSSSNRAAIRDLKWLGDNQTIAFLGENPREASQVYAFYVPTRHLEKLTNHPSSVTGYDLTPNAQEIIYFAESKNVADAERTRREGIAITSQYLVDILAGDNAKSFENGVFLWRSGQSVVPVPVEDAVHEHSFLSLSADGRFAIVEGYVHEPPKLWEGYTDPGIHERLLSKGQKGQAILFRRYLLINTADKSVSPLLNTPVTSRTSVAWAPDGQELLIKGTYLPLDVNDAAERRQRQDKTYDIAISVTTRLYRQFNAKAWPIQSNQSPALEVKLDQNLNAPPKLYAVEPTSGRKTQLLDLNPQFQELTFGMVKVIEIKVAGIEMLCGLYLPPDYTPDRRYPLVIQTHGFDPDEFSMDGRSEWSSGFAARALAAKGIVVLQASTFKNKIDHDRVGADRTLGVTSQQAHKRLHALSYELAIDRLDQDGIVDRARVGIIGFSRTVCIAAYDLTHSRYEFAAATLVDGVDCGYFQHIAVPTLPADDDALNGGAAPFGEGLREWLKESPSFNLDRVRAPVQLIALTPGAVLGLWEWFAGLTLQDKPVDLIEIPDASHQIVKPWERRIAQQGIVDWYCFWLQGKSDPALEKRDQYSRWNQLKRQHEQVGQP